MKTYPSGCGSLLRHIGCDHLYIVLSETRKSCDEFLVMRLDIKTGKLYYHYSDRFGKVDIIEY